MMVALKAVMMVVLKAVIAGKVLVADWAVNKVVRLG